MNDHLTNEVSIKGVGETSIELKYSSHENP